MKELIYKLVPAQRGHLKEVAALECACFSPPWSEELLAGELDRAETEFLVAEGEGGAVLGYGLVRTVLNEGCLEKIAVSPAVRRRGIARDILSAYLRFGRARLAFLTLEVRAGNHAAIALYRSLGLREAGRRKQYYTGPDEDAVIMTIEFAENGGPTP